MRSSRNWGGEGDELEPDEDSKPDEEPPSWFQTVASMVTKLGPDDDLGEFPMPEGVEVRSRGRD
jgi:hypothetical protein